MNPAQQKNSPATRFAVFLLAAVLATAGVTLLLSAIWGREGLLATQQQKNEIIALQQELADTRRQNDLLANKIKALTNDMEAQKDEIRRILGLIGPDEVILVPKKKP